MIGIHPFRVLRAKPLWIASGVITGVLALLFAVLYVGANIDPAGHMKNLPVGLVNADKGAAVGGKQVNLGAEIAGSIRKSTAGGDKIDWRVMGEREMKEELGKGKLYGALVVPGDFTSSVTALTGTAANRTPVRPALTVLTNQSAGSLGSSLARVATTRAAESASLHIGKGLTAQAGAEAAKLPTAARVLLADPAAVTVRDGHPLDSHSGLGLTAFYYALALVVCGMLSANVISGQVDHALGYTHNDMGPLHLHRPTPPRCSGGPRASPRTGPLCRRRASGRTPGARTAPGGSPPPWKPIGFDFVRFELTSRYDHQREAKFQRAAAGGSGHAHLSGRCRHRRRGTVQGGGSVEALHVPAVREQG
ncbi:YhgE/Pip domain-containing protein [Streptomyces sp. NPDC087903]|uniref:YhgE/Pip domain-containing protein n=1 Tax=Streptomyces sp. NPDC087903 TaxID=3365819 RepID=UPI0037F31E98